MKLIRGLHNLPSASAPASAVTIGVFDGVHRGHQAVIEQLQTLARQQNLRAVLVCFEPSPREFFQGAAAPARLTRLGEKLPLLQACGLDTVLCLRFNAALAALSPAVFVQKVLVEGLSARQVTVGEDFRYGQDRAGDFAQLMAAGQQHGFAVSATPTVMHAGERISSTRIRAALAAGELIEARDLLGRDYSISGRVVYGEQLGRRLGFPTVNIPLRRRSAPVAGVFVVRVAGAAKQPVYGVASVGTRPTVSGSGAWLLEVHLFDYNAELYGRRLDVTFLHKLRDEQTFANHEELRAWIARDAEQAQKWLHNRNGKK